jgi:hypothetical protein
MIPRHPHQPSDQEKTQVTLFLLAVYAALLALFFLTLHFAPQIDAWGF